MFRSIRQAPKEGPGSDAGLLLCMVASVLALARAAIRGPELRSRRFADGAAEMRAWPSKPNDAVGPPILTTQRASCRPRRITSD
jgi:hypothetical protein